MENLFALTINGTPIPAPSGIPSGPGYSLGFIAKRGIEIALVFGILISMVYLMYGGFFWLQSKGNKELLDKARRIIINSIIGLLIMSFSLVIVSIITNMFGVKSLIGQ
ncbi:MAG: hypothetical protein A2776_02505 [Candidatus Levybacteria bacterium RIFCSPHIGHO2_01_FULL_40_10]|nr:MAG: hypothetical protein A2776_02505 [Candidatus Levybacteria bacterium RIFCSPHIGHO2_01_FULL_40_10]